MMKIPEKFDAITLCRIISIDFPDIQIHTVRILDNGWDNVVADINNDLIFRFPRDACENNTEADTKQFDLELYVLNFLNDKITLHIPYPEYVGKSYTYFGYKKIKGSTLTEEIYNSLTNEEKQKLHSDLANFLKGIHFSLSVDDANELGIRSEDTQSYINIIENKLLKSNLDKSVLEFAQTTCEEYKELITQTTRKVFLFNDLHPNNFAFDLKTKMINGVYDFGDIKIGDIDIDFSYLYRLNAEFLRGVAVEYEKLTGIKINLRLAVINCRMNELCDLADSEASKDIKQGILNLIPKWNKEVDVYL